MDVISSQLPQPSFSSRADGSFLLAAPASLAEAPLSIVTMTSSQHSERCVTPSSYLRNVLKTVGGGAPEKQTSGLARRFCSKRSLHLRGQSSVFTQEITQPDVHESAVQRELLHAGRCMLDSEPCSQLLSDYYRE